MAVPGRRNGMIDEDENEDNALFEEEGLIEFDSDTPPHLRDLAAASELGNLDALRLALDNLTGSIDEPVEDGDTALHLACLYGHLPCVQLLLERGANLEAEDEDGGIPLHDACAGGFVEIAQLLLNTAKDSECIKRMLESVDAEGETPLHHAARGEHAAVVRLLLSSGASPTQSNTCGKTPIELADPGTEARSILEAAVGAAACETIELDGKRIKLQIWDTTGQEHFRTMTTGVGKRCLLLRFSDDSFTTSFITTIGLGPLSLMGSESNYKMGYYWPRTFSYNYNRVAMGILLVYNVIDESSYIKNWIRNIEQHAFDNVNKILVGNKADIDESERDVETVRVQALADEYGIEFFEMSDIADLTYVSVVQPQTLKISKLDPATSSTAAAASRKSTCCGS